MAQTIRAILLASAIAATLVGRRASKAVSHVWTAPGWQELFSRFAALVGAAMCPAF
jgi:hypothetical protein